MKNKLSIHFSKRCFSEQDIEILINESKGEFKEAIKLAYYDGLKINQINDILDMPRRTMQGKLSRLGRKIFGLNICFEQLRLSCVLRLLNKGYTPDYISDFMGYSRKDTIAFKRKLAGYLNPKLRYKILKRDNFKCILCGSNIDLHIDHIKPVSKGGKTNEKNLRTLCKECNLGRNNEN